MRKTARSFALIAVVACTSLILAGVTTDLRIDTKRDTKQNVIYQLVNTSSKNVVAKVEHRKDCSGVTNRQEPKVQQYWLGPNETVQLAKAWRSSTCRLSFRIVEAENY